MATPSPNVLLIITDDQGTLDMGCYGAADLRTPNMDALASAGVRFTQFYVAAPLCSASRASLFTGHYFQRVLTEHGIDPRFVTMAEIFHEFCSILPKFKAFG